MRKLERAADNKGTVVTYDNFGKPASIYVPDVPFFKGLFENSDMCWNFKRANKAISNVFEGTTPISLDMTDKDLQDAFPDLRLDKSGAVNTEDLFKSFPLIGGWFGNGFVIPNLYEAIVILQEADRIDALNQKLQDAKKLNWYRSDAFNLSLGDVLRFVNKKTLITSTKYNRSHVTSLFGCQYDDNIHVDIECICNHVTMLLIKEL